MPIYKFKFHHFFVGFHHFSLPLSTLPSLHLRQHTTPPFSFAKTDFIQSILTSRENFCFGFQLNDLQPLRSSKDEPLRSQKVSYLAQGVLGESEGEYAAQGDRFSLCR
jgi:hypothetical protein